MDCVDSDDDYEYEETTVVAEIQGVMDAEFLADVKQAKILGIDGEKPLLQLDDYTFSGHYEDTVGTCMLFRDVTNEEDPDNTEKKLEYSCLSFKKLCLQSVFLKKNDDKIPEKSKEGEKLSASKPSASASYITSETLPEQVPIETDKPPDVVSEELDKNTNEGINDSAKSTSDSKNGT